MTPAEEKQQTLNEYLRGGVVAILLDSRQQGVDVPEQYRRQDLKLNLSHRYSHGPNLIVNTWGFTCTLSFSGVNCPVAVPWAALYAMRSNDGHVAAWEAPGEPLPIGKRRGILGLVN